MLLSIFTKIYINYDKKRHSVHFRDKVIFRNKEKALFSRKSSVKNTSKAAKDTALEVFLISI